MSEPIHLLLAEDEESDVLITRRALTRCSTSTHLEVVRDGQALLDRLAAGPSHPDLILLDFNLPKVNGLEALEAIKADPRSRAIPILMLTTSERPEEIRAAYSRGVNAFIVKPIRFARFVEVMEGVLTFWGGVVHLPNELTANAPTTR